ncbi:MAG: cobalamin biosynthesis protein CobD [Nitrospirae bacterium]|nr:cobalamin biosynthesis protein CobD [Nitrospirota bacterium]
MPPLYIVLAFALDAALGDPRRIPHPVRAIGWAVSVLEGLLIRPGAGRIRNRLAGTLLVIIVVSSVFIITYLLIESVRLAFGGWACAALSVLLGYTTLAARGLADAGRDVLTPLEAGDLGAARKALSMVVGRDTGGLDEADVARGAVETVSENASDGVVAPLLYLAMGGAPLALAYKAVNTMDSMVGYRNERYMDFGWAAARLDDLANFIPARLTALLMVAASSVLTGFGLGSYSPGGSWRVLVRDRRNHTSPNSGYPEAAAAGALRVRLGGTSSYFGVPSAKPFMGDPDEPLGPGKIRDAVRLMYTASVLALGVSVGIAYCVSAFDVY